MNTICTKCNINWARLLTCEVGEEDQIEVCPQCLTDMNLVEGNESNGHIKCPISGKIINVDTKQELVIKTPLPSYFRPTRNRPAMTDTYAVIEEKDNRALKAYHESGNQNDFFK